MTTHPTDGALQGVRIPTGAYDLTVERNRTLVAHTFGDHHFESAPGAAAHPVMAHLASHCGKGWTFPEFLDRVGAKLSDGLVFAGGTFAFAKPLRSGASYSVEAVVEGVVRKTGRRAGTFDLVTVSHRLTDESGDEVATTTETILVPRSRAGSSSSASPGEHFTPSPGGRVYEVGPVRLPDIVAIMDLMGDTNPVHVDRDLAVASGYRGVVNQGPANLAYVFTALADWRNDISHLRTAEFRFHDTVTEGDILRVHAPADIAVSTEADLVLEIVGSGVASRVHVRF